MKIEIHKHRVSSDEEHEVDNIIEAIENYFCKNESDMLVGIFPILMTKKGIEMPAMFPEDLKETLNLSQLTYNFYSILRLHFQMLQAEAKEGTKN